LEKSGLKDLSFLTSDVTLFTQGIQKQSNTGNFAKSLQSRQPSEKLQMQGARILRDEAYMEVRRNDAR
jgi:hypothetical protein